MTKLVRARLCLITSDTQALMRKPHTLHQENAAGYICKLTADTPLMGHQRAVTIAQGVWSKVWQIISPALVVYRVVVIIIAK